MDAPDPSDADLITAALAGDDPAFAVLAGRYRSKVLGMASRFSSDPHDHEDLVQEIFVRAWRQLSQFRGEAPFEHWLSRLAIRCCYDHLRRRKRRVPIDSPLSNKIPASEYEGVQRARELVDLALSRLDAADRLVITLLELEGRSVREISEAIGWSESKVKVRAFRARATMRNFLSSLHER